MIYFGCVGSVQFELFSSSAHAGGCMGWRMRHAPSGRKEEVRRKKEKVRCAPRAGSGWESGRAARGPTGRGTRSGRGAGRRVDGGVGGGYGWSMSLVIEMPEAVEAKVREKCARVGRAVDEVAVDVFEAWLGEERPVERFGDLPMCGMWKDREDMADPEAWVRDIRAPRHFAGI